MTTTTYSDHGPPGPGRPGGLLGSWVEAQAEPCRGGRTYRLLVNHRTHQALELTDAEAAICDRLTAGLPAGDRPGAAAFTADLREHGFLATAPPPPPGRRLQVSAATLDLRWAGAHQLVTALYQRGARHLFRPGAVTAQVLLALAGLAAVARAIFSGQHFQLRVHPAQVPVVLGLSLAAVAVHELAHALVVVRHHRTVDAAGVRLHLGTPAFYVESADALLLTRRQRLIQAGAGVWAEWQFTSLIAIWLWVAPVPAATPLLHRFVILNAATIATNLLPFTGLDGSWLLADAAGAPDLARRARGAVTRLLTALARRQRVPAAGRILAGYAALNGLAAAALLGTAGFFWYQLFGDLAATVARHGPAGWALLAAGAVILGRPAVATAAAWLAAAARTAGELHAALAFRLQWRWRIPATRTLAAGSAQLGALGGPQLGVLAGQLQRTRRPAAHTLRALAGSHGIVRAGTMTATSSTGQLVVLAAGATWGPQHQLQRGSATAALIHLPAAALHQILAASPAGTQAAALPE